MGNLNITRLIILLEISQKLYTFLFMKRLSDVLVKWNVLTGINWTELLGGIITFPIATMNNMIEDVIANNKSLWTLL